MSFLNAKKSVLIAFIAAMGSGCATVCDRQCNLEESARAMAGNKQDAGVRATGVYTLEKIHPEIKAAGDKTRDQILPKTG